ncbi:uncharacterized protein [Pyxicephalus adspersus]|uniref:uncharacterized protein n=1 Tax=Pyxicephalus adspersus TaxID=30357 RepID=UPI003B5BCB5D
MNFIKLLRLLVTLSDLLTYLIPSQCEAAWISLQASLDEGKKPGLYTGIKRGNEDLCDFLLDTLSDNPTTCHDNISQVCLKSNIVILTTEERKGLRYYLEYNGISTLLDPNSNETCNSRKEAENPQEYKNQTDTTSNASGDKHLYWLFLLLLILPIIAVIGFFIWRSRRTDHQPTPNNTEAKNEQSQPLANGDTNTTQPISNQQNDKDKVLSNGGLPDIDECLIPMESSVQESNV